MRVADSLGVGLTFTGQINAFREQNAAASPVRFAVGSAQGLCNRFERCGAKWRAIESSASMQNVSKQNDR